MSSPSFLIRLIGLPLCSLALALALVSHQAARQNRYTRELKEAQAEYERLSRGLAVIPTAAADIFAGSYPHEHSGSEEEAAHVDPMTLPPPSHETADEERKLFLTPGGVYTQADIEANGKILPSQKFAGLIARHDMHPQPGQRLCPITNTRADAQFSWIVGGKSYAFCCPPCVHEFVVKAKQQTKSLPSPETYVQR